MSVLGQVRGDERPGTGEGVNECPGTGEGVSVLGQVRG